MKKIEIKVDSNFGEELIVEETQKGTFWITLVGYMDDIALEVKKEHIEQLKNFLNEL